MRIMIYSGEASVAEIANKLFVRLTPNQRARVEAALLKANPRLKNLQSIPEGSVLRVPDLPKLHAKPGRNLENTDTQIADRVVDSLSSYREQLEKNIKREKKAVKEQTALLKNRLFKKEVSTSPVLKDLVERVAAVSNTRAKEITKRTRLLDTAIKQLNAELHNR